MRADRVDPTDAWFEVDPVGYRVYFYEVMVGGQQNYAAEEWRLYEVRDVSQVVAWADEGRRGRQFVVYAELIERSRVTLVRLAGEDPIPSRSSTKPSET